MSATASEVGCSFSGLGEHPDIAEAMHLVEMAAAMRVNRRGIFTPDRRAIETPLVDGLERVGDRSCGA